MKIHRWSWATSWPVVGLWATVSLSVALASLSAVFSPTWYITDSVPPTMFGVWTWCIASPGEQECAAVGEPAGNAPGTLPSVVWVMVGAVYGGGGVLLAVTGVIALLTPFLPSTHARGVAAYVASNIQAAAVSLQVVGLLLYPLGLGSAFARQHCGTNTSIYSPGNCQLGYAYMLALVATALASYCPVLARLVTYKNYSECYSNLNYL